MEPSKKYIRRSAAQLKLLNFNRITSNISSSTFFCFKSMYKFLKNFIQIEKRLLNLNFTCTRTFNCKIFFVRLKIVISHESEFSQNRSVNGQLQWYFINFPDSFVYLWKFELKGMNSIHFKPLLAIFKQLI